MTAKMVIASAARLIEVRHFWKRKRIAEISVPACPMPTQNTKFVMSHAQPTGTLSPQMPIPSQKSHETATPRRPRSGGRDEVEPPADRRRPLDRPRDGLGDGMEIRRAQDECGLARDRVVEQFCFRLGQTCSLRFLKVVVCTYRAFAGVKRPPPRAVGALRRGPRRDPWRRRARPAPRGWLHARPICSSSGSSSSPEAGMQVRILAPFCRTHRICARKRAHHPAGLEDRFPFRASVASCRSDGAPAERWICDMRDASSRASSSPEFMLCTPTGGAWCAASPASHTPPLPKLRVEA